MHLPPPENLLSTNEAAKLSGYSADYLARLGRSKKIKAFRIGRNWFLDKESFGAFVEQQGDRKEAYARALARARGQEYREHRSPVRRVARVLTSPVPVPTFALGRSLRGEVVAVVVALLVVGSASVLAAHPSVPRVMALVGETVGQVRVGFLEIAHDAVEPFALRLAAVRALQQETARDIARSMRFETEALALPQFATPDLSRFALVVPESEESEIAEPMFGQTPHAAPLALPTLADLAKLSPQAIAGGVAHAYLSLGDMLYRASRATIALAPATLKTSGAIALDTGTYARDLIARAPEAVSRVNLALGTVVIEGTHTAIHADVALSYAVADAAPRSAELVATAIGTTGLALANFTAALPHEAAARGKLAIAEWQEAAPRFAQAGFEAEYALASAFVEGTNALFVGGAQVLGSAGAVAYEGAALGAELAADASPLTKAVSNFALAMAGGSALLVEQATEAFVTPITDATSEMLAAAATTVVPPATLTTGESAAFTTYVTINSLFNYASDALAYLWEPRPYVVTPIGVQKIAEVATTTTTKTTVVTGPVYNQTYSTGGATTINVNGVTQEVLNQSLATLRAELTNTILSIARPVVGQIAQNIQTIQLNNRIEHLTDLKVTNGTFEGGTHTGATNITTAALAVTGTGTTTFAGPINVAAGSCLAIDGTCLSSSGNPNVSNATGILAVANGGTGTSTAPAYGQVLLGDGLGNYSLVATSSLGISGGGAGTLTGLGSGWATTTGSTITFSTSTASFNGLTFGQTIVPSANTLTFTPTISGFLEIAGGGTGTSTAPTYGQLLVGNSSGGFDYLATSSLGIAATGGTGTGSVSTSTLETAGQLSYWTTTGGYPARLASVATSSYSVSGPFSLAGTLGALVGGSNSTLTYWGISTTSNLTGGQILTSNGGAGVSSVATSSFAVSGPFSTVGTLGNFIGGSNSTVTYYGLATTTAISQGQLLYGTSASGVSSVATSSLSVSGPFSTSGLGYLVGGSSPTITYYGLATTSALTAGQLLMSNGGGGVSSIATTTVSCTGSASCTSFTILGSSPISISVTGGGGGGGTWSTTTSSVVGTYINYPNNGSDVVVVGSNATTSAEYWFDPNIGRTYLSGSIGIGTTTPAKILSLVGDALFTGDLTLANLTATGTISAATLSLTNALGVSSGGTGATSFTSSQLVYGNGTNALQSVATSSLTVSGPFSTSGMGYLVGGSSPTISYYGVATTSALTGGQILTSNGGAGVSGVATSSFAVSGPFSTAGTLGNFISGSNSTLTYYGLATTTNIAQGQLLYGTSASGVSSVATSSITLGTGLSYSGTLGSLVGGSAGSLTVATSSLYTGTTGQFPYFSGTNTITATSSVFLAANGNVGIGTTSPYAKLSIFAPNTGGPTTLFAIGSSTSAFATSTLFKVSNIGSTTLRQIPSSVLYTDSSSTIVGSAFGGNGTVLALVGGVPTWTATTTLSTISGTLGVASGGTGATSFNSSQLVYGNGTNALQSVATTSYAVSGPFSLAGTLGALVGGSNSTLTWWGISTTSNLTGGQLVMSNGGAGVSSVATSSATLGLGLSGSLTGIGASNSLTLATSSLFTGTQGQVAYFDGTNSLSGTSTLFISTARNVGIGTTSPFARLSVFANATDSYNQNLFVIGSSTSAFATSTLFKVSATGSTTLYQLPSQLLKTDSSGTIIGAIAGIDYATPSAYEIATTSDIALSQLTYVNRVGGRTTLASVATTSYAVSGPFSTAGTLGALVGGSNSTITYYGLSTTTNISQSQLLYGTSASGVSSVATSSVTAGTGVTFSGTAGALVGGTSLTINTPWTADGANVYKNNAGNIGIGSSTPYALLSVFAPATGASTTLFAIGSSTSAFATSTFFRVSNIGSTTLYQIPSQLLKTDPTGTIVGAIAGVDYATPGQGGSAFEVATTSDIAVSQLTYVNKVGGRTTLASVATTSYAVSGPFSLAGTLGALVGGSNSTLTYWGLSTTSTLTAGQILTSNGGAGVSGVGTSTPSLPSYITYSGTLGSFVGGADGSFAISSLPTANGGTGTTTYYSGGVVYSDGTKLTQSSTPLNFFWSEVRNALGLGTSTPYHTLTVSSSTGPQLALTDDSATANPWTFRSVNGNFYLATSSPSTFATSSVTAISIDANGQVSFGLPLGPTSGGTGISTYTQGDLLYADSANHLTKLGIGSPNEVLKVSGGVPVWGIDQAGGGGAGGTWSTTTSQVAGTYINYPNNASDVVAIGANATTSAEYWFDPNTTTAYLSRNVGIGTTSPGRGLSLVGDALFTGSAYLANLTATGTLSVTGQTTLASSLSGVLYGNSGAVNSVATSSITLSGILSSGTAGYLVGGSGFTITGAIATATAETAGGLAYWSTTSGSPARLNTIATTSVACGGAITCDPFVAIGSSPITISAASAGASKWATSTADGQAIAPTDALRVGIGTTTPKWALQVASSTGTQLTLSDGATTHWSFRSINGNLFVGTSSATTYATTSLAALTVNSNGYLGVGTTSPGSLLSVGGTTGINFSTATSSFKSTGGIDLLGGGCYAVNGTCLTAFSNTLAGGGTATTSFYAGGVVFSDGTKLTQAPHTGSGIFAWDNTNYRLGIGTSSPQWGLSLSTPTGQRIKTTTNNSSAFGVENAEGATVFQIGTLNGPSSILSVASSTGQSYLEVIASGLVGVGTTSPYASLSVWSAGSTTAVTAFEVVNSASSTLFSINGLGSTTLRQLPSQLLKTDSSGTIIGAIAGIDYATPSAYEIATTSDIALSQLTYVNKVGGRTTLASVATTSYAVSGPFSLAGTLGALVGGSNSTLTWWGISTTSNLTGGQILTSNGGAGVSSVATSSITLSGLSYSGTLGSLIGGSAGTLSIDQSALALSKWATSSADSQAISPNSALRVGIGTTTPKWALTIASSTGPQLALTDGSSTASPWTFRSINGNFYLATSSATTYATSSVPALTFDTGGNGFFLGKVGIGTTSPSSTLHLYHPADNDTRLTIDANNNREAQIALQEAGITKWTIRSEAGGGRSDFILQGTDSENPFIIEGSAAANSFYITDPGVVALGGVVVDGASALQKSSFVVHSNGNSGAGTTSPYARLSVHANNGDTNTTLFAIGSSTATATSTLFSVSNIGSTTLYQIPSSLLKTDSNGTIIGAIAGVDYATPSAYEIATTSDIALSQLTYVNRVGGRTTLASVATTSYAVSGPFSTAGTLGALVGGTNSTLTWWGISTTSALTAGQLVMSNGGAGVSGVATSSITAGTGISFTGTPGALIGGTSLTINSTSGAFPFTIGETNFGVAVNSTTTPIWFKAGLQASSTAHFTTLNTASTTLLSLYGGSVGIGTSSPYAGLSIFVSTTTGITQPTTIFNIASSSNGSATTTLFSVSNVGSTTLSKLTNQILYANTNGAIIGTSTIATAYGGTGVSSLTTSQLLYGNGAGNAVAQVATSTFTVAGPFTVPATLGSVVGGSNTTITYWGISTTSNLTGGQLVMSNGGAGVSGVGTSTPSLPSYLTYSGTLGNFIGGSSGSFAISQLPVANGGTGTTTFYSGGVVYSDGTKLTQSASPENFFWDETNKRLGLGTTSPWAQLSINSTSALGTSPAFAIGSTTATVFSITPRSGGSGIFAYGGPSTSTVPNNSPYAWTIATSTTGTPLFKIDTTSGNEIVSIGGAGTDVIIGDVGQPANLVFEESAKIKGQGTGRTITIGDNADIINFGVNVGIGSTSPYAKLSIHATSTESNLTLFAIGSSTSAFATTTLFSINNIGSTTMGRFGECSGANALTTNSDGTIVCAPITAVASSAFEIATTSDIALSQLTYVNRVGGRTTLASVATSSYAVSGPFSLAGTLGALVGGSNSTITYWGISTTSNLTGGQLVMSNGGAGVSSVATSSATLGLGLSGSLTGIGASNSLTLATSSLFTGTQGQVAYFDGTNSLIGTSTLFISTARNVGIGTTSPFARLSVFANATDSYNQNLFVIGSSTSAFATSTLFKVSATGSTTLYQLPSQLLKTDSSGTIIGAIAGIDYATPSAYEIATTSDIALSQLTYVNRVGGRTTLASVATTSYAVSGPFSTAGTLGALVGGSNSTLTYWGLSTTSNLTGGQILTSNGGAGVSGVGTSTVTLSGLSYSGTLGSLVGGTDGTLSIDQSVLALSKWATSSADAQAISPNSALRVGIGTTTPKWALTISSSTGPQLALTDGLDGTSPWTFRSINGNFYLATSSATTYATSTDTRFMIDRSGKVGIGTTSPSGALSIFSNTGDVYQTVAGTPGTAVFGVWNNPGNDVNYSIGNHAFVGSNTNIPFDIRTNNLARFTVTAAGKVGVGTTTAFSQLQVATSSSGTLYRGQLSLTDTNAATDLKHWLFSAINGNLYLGTTTDSYATTTTSVLSLSNDGDVRIGNAVSTTTLPGGFDVGNGALQYDYGRNVTTIERLDTGNLSFETNAGAVSWFDFPVTDAAPTSTVERYTAQINSNPLLTIYAESNGNANAPIKNARVGIASTSPWGAFSINPTALSGDAPAFVIGSTSQTLFTVSAIGSTTLAKIPSTILTTNANGTIVGTTSIGVAYGGTGVTSFTSSQLVYGSGAGALAQVATSSYAVSGPFSLAGTLGALVGGSNSTLTYWGLSTTSNLTAGQLVMSNGGAGVSSVATSSITLSGLSYSGTLGSLIGGSAGTLSIDQSALALSKWATSTVDAGAISPAGAQRVGLGTTTPKWALTVASSTGPQLALTDGLDGTTPWTFRSINGNFYLATSSPSTFATTTVPTLTILGTNGNVGVGTTSPFAQLSVHGTPNSGVSALPALAVYAGNNGTNDRGASLLVLGGRDDGATETGGLINLTGGGAQDVGGAITLTGGSDGSGGNGTGATVTVNGNNNEIGGHLTLTAGTGASAGVGGAITLSGGSTSGGDVTINGGAGGSGIGDVLLASARGLVGIGTTTPHSLLTIYAASTTGFGAPTTLFQISSTTGGTSNTDLFSISNIGTTTLGRFGTCSGSNALTTDSSGAIICGAITAAAQPTAYEVATTSDIAVSQIAYINKVGGRTTLASVATSSLSVSGPFSTSGMGYLVGGSSPTITYYGISTTSSLTGGQLVMSNGGAGVSGVATSSATLGLGLSGSIIGIGASNSLTLATSSLFSGTQGQVAYFDGTNSLVGTSTLFVASNGRVGIGTTTPSAQLTISNFATASTSIPFFNITMATTSNPYFYASSTASFFKISYASSTEIFGKVIRPEFKSQERGTTPGTTLDGAASVVVVDNYAYVTANTRASLAVIDVSNPADPIFVAEERGPTAGTTLAGAYGLAVAGNYAYVANFDRDSLAVIDISNPSDPVFIAEERGPSPGTTFDGAYAVAVSGNYAYLASFTRDAISVIDITNPTDPVFVTELRDTTALNGPNDIFIQGNYAYLALANRASLAVIDISNPANPIRIAEEFGPTPGTSLLAASAVFVQGKYAYVTQYSPVDNFTIIDISNPADPIYVSNTQGPDSNDDLNGANDVFVSGDYAYVVNRDGNSFTVLDISNPADPVFLAESLGEPGAPLTGAYGVYVAGNYAYVANFTQASLAVFDVGGARISNFAAGNAKIENLQVNSLAGFALGASFGGGLNVQGGVYANQGGTFLKIGTTTSIASTTLQWGSQNIGPALTAHVHDASVGGVTDVLSLTHTATTSSVAGIGTGLLFNTNTFCGLANCSSAGATTTATSTARIASILTNVSTSTVASDLLFFTKGSSLGLTESARITGAGNFGLGTSTAYHRLTVASSTGPQLALTDGSATANPWTLRSINGYLYIGTSSPSTYATTTSPAITISPDNSVRFGNASTTCIALTGSSALCDGADATSAGGTDPFTFTTNFGQTVAATSSILWLQNGLQASSTANLADINTIGILNFASTTYNASSTLLSIKGETLLTASTTGLNTGFGLSSLSAVTTGQSLTAVGNNALKANTSGGFNSAFGDSALLSNTTGANNTALGYWAMADNISGAGNVAIGSGARQNATSSSDNNVAIGYNALLGNNAQAYGSNNIAIGRSALSNNSLGSENVAIGHQQGNFITTGYANILLGASTGGGNLTSGSRNIGIGNDVSFPSATGNDQLNIGNLIFGALPATSTSLLPPQLPTSGALGIGSTSPYAKLSIHTNNGDTARTLFAIGSSTATATTTLFSIDNRGNVSAPITTATTTIGGGLAVGSAFVAHLNGNVGVGTAAPATQLHVNNSGGSTSLRISSSVGSAETAYYDGGTRKWSTGLQSTNDFAIKYNDVTKVTFLNNGAVGIGTTTPSHALTIASSTAAQLALTDASATANAWTLRSVNGNFYLATSSPSTYATSTTAAISIDSTGTVTFGNAPATCAALTGSSALCDGDDGTSAGSGSAPFTLANNMNQTVGATTTGLWLQGSPFALMASSTAILATSTGPQLHLSGGNNGAPYWSFRSINGNLYFGTTSASTLATSTDTRLTIGANGSVGVGTSTPSTPLDVYGAAVAGAGTLGITTPTSGAFVNVLTGLAPNLTAGQASFIAVGKQSSVLDWTSMNFVYAGSGSVLNRTDFNFHSGGTVLSLVANKRVGIGTTSPSALLTLSTSTEPQLALTDGSLTSNIWNFRNINGNLYIGTSSPSTYATSSTPVLAITASATNATTSLTGGFDVHSGALQYDVGRNVTTIERLETGNLSFETNAGAVSWIDLPVTDAAPTSTPESYTAQIAANPLLTVYAESNGNTNSLIKNTRVGIASTSPWATFSINPTALTGSGPVFAIGSTSQTLLTVDTNGTTTLKTATTTRFYGAGLASCTSNNVLTWENGQFGCEADDGGAAAAIDFVGGTTYNTLSAATSSSLWTTGQLFASSTVTFGATGQGVLRFDTSTGNLGLGTTSPKAVLDIASTSRSAERIRLSGQEFFAAGNTDDDGISLLAGVNRANNRQLWIADSGALTQNNANAAIRLMVGSAISNPQIGAIATDGVGVLDLTLQGGGGSLGIGGNPGQDTIAHIAASSTADELVVGDDVADANDDTNRINLFNTDNHAFLRIGQSATQYLSVGWQLNSVPHISTSDGRTLVLQASGGNIGISTSTPSSKLHIYEDGAFVNLHSETLNPTQRMGYVFSELAAGTSTGLVYDGSGLGDNNKLIIHDYTNAVDRVTFLRGGSVGIGTTTPRSFLTVSSSTAPQIMLTDAGSVSSPWTLRSINSNFYLATTSVTTGATSTTAAIAVDHNGIVTFGNAPATCALLTGSSALCDGDDGGGGGGGANPFEFNTTYGTTVGATTTSIWLRTGAQLFASSTVRLGGGILDFSVNSTSTISGTGPYAWTLATSTTARPIISIDATTGSTTIGTPGGDVMIGDPSLQWTTNLVFASSSTIKGDNGGKTLTFGSGGDKINFAVNTGFGTSSPWRTLAVNGTVAFSALTATSTNGNALCLASQTFGYEVTLRTGSNCAASSLRFKHDIEDTAIGLDEVLAMRPVNYVYNEGDGRVRVGFIAEEVNEIDPRLVDYDAGTNTPGGVQYENYTAVLTNAIQEIVGVVDVRGGRTGTSTLVTNYQGTSTPAISIDAAGNVGVGTTTNANYRLAAGGDIAATGFVNVSTAAVKTNITHLGKTEEEAILDELENVQVANYRYVSEPSTDPLRLGLIAEEAPTDVLSADGKGVDLYKLATYNLAATKALSSRLAALALRVDSIEARLAQLEAGVVSTTTGTSTSLFSTTTLASAFEALGAYIQKGIAQFGTIIADQFVAATDEAGNSSAGAGVILAGNLVTEVTNPLVHPSSKIFVTFTSPVASWYLSDKQEGKFRITIAATSTADTAFDYFIIQTAGQIATSTPATSTAQTGASTTPETPDTTPPTITMNGDNPLYIAVGANYADAGVTALDDQGGPVTIKYYVDGFAVPEVSIDTSTAETHLISYEATDERGNFTTAVRIVHVGEEAPVVEETTSTPPAPEEVATSTPPAPEPALEPAPEPTPEPAPLPETGTSTPETGTSTPPTV